MLLYFTPRRYAWFSFNKKRAPGTTSALYRTDGETLTKLGEIYRDHGKEQEKPTRVCDKCVVA